VIYNLVKEFKTKNEMIKFHKISPAEAYRGNKRIGYRAYNKAKNDLQIQTGQLDLISGEYTTNPETL